MTPAEDNGNGNAAPWQRVQAALDELGIPSRVIQFEASTRTAEDAAAAVGCLTGQIVKSLFFLAGARPTLVLVAGDRQADTAKLATLLGTGRKKLKMGTPEEVAAATGYEVGAVSPLGLLRPCDVVVDQSLQRFDCAWAAAGTGNTLFAVGPETLVRATGGQWAAITRDAS